LNWIRILRDRKAPSIRRLAVSASQGSAALAAPRPMAVIQSSRSPGTDGPWTFVFIDMIIFLMIFFTFMSERLRNVDLYAASQLRLNEIFGLANTLILLTSSWMVVAAVQAARQNEGTRVRWFLGWAWLLGLAFSVDKFAEYYLKIHAGITPATNSFFSFYFFITAVHFLHVIAGMFFIGYCRSKARLRIGTGGYVIGLENVGLFWHFVDVLWIFIFPLLYMVGRQ
jgi:nitric oxide reductase NorE protein